jgi:hypothetical protein
VDVVAAKKEEEEMSMQSFHFSKRAIFVVSLLGVMFPFLVEAAPPEDRHCVSRPLSDFLDAQGTLNDPPDFFPPVPDYVGWAGDFPGDCSGPPAFTPGTFGLVDYAGLANEYIEGEGGESLRTTVRGRVRECKLPDGKARVTVTLSTKRALGFAQPVDELCPNFNFAGTTTNFGNKTLDVLAGEPAAVGPVTLVTSFTIPFPGADLPDYLNVAFGNGFAPAKLHFVSSTFGTRPDGTKAHMLVLQKATVAEGEDWVYSIEEVKLLGAEDGD